MTFLRSSLLLSLSIAALVGPSLHASTAELQSRLDGLQDSGESIVVHIVVALCDNQHQGIVPVPASLGDGQAPRTNLYWGALYGVRTHLSRSGYRLLEHSSQAPDGVLERVVFSKTLQRSSRPIELVLVADAWDGRLIAASIEHFLEFAAGHAAEEVPLASGSSVHAGGASSLVAFVGHNGLMDFDLPEVPSASESPMRGAIVLACASKQYFLEPLRKGGSHPVLLTTGLMAPEAYTLEAALEALVEGADSAGIHESAAQAYNSYQKCGVHGARRLFYVE